MKNICIYHANCLDGFTAAWVVAHLYGDSLEYIPAAYQDTPPDVEGKKVFIVDFSYKRSVMEEIVKKAKCVVHIDHHDTAIKDMEGFAAPNFLCSYSSDNSKSGCMLTWEYFVGGEVPDLVKYVDDRDLWKFRLPGSREVQATLYSYAYTFENWNFLSKQSVDDLIREGTAINRRMYKDALELLPVLTRKINICGYVVPAVNCPKQFGEDMANILSKDAPFAVYYYDMPDHREFRLRSVPGGAHVGKIAQFYGGGGHEHAAGFRASYATSQQFEID